MAIAPSDTHPGARVWLINSGANIAEDMAGVPLDPDEPEVVVLGGAGDAFDHRTLSRVADMMRVEPTRLMMVGDDLHSDVIAAQRAGLTGVLVRTGEFREVTLEMSPDRPDHIIDSIADLPALLG